jgi:hypothetical protein
MKLDPGVYLTCVFLNFKAFGINENGSIFLTRPMLQPHFTWEINIFSYLFLYTLTLQVLPFHDYSWFTIPQYSLCISTVFIALQNMDDDRNDVQNHHLQSTIHWLNSLVVCQYVKTFDE